MQDTVGTAEGTEIIVIIRNQELISRRVRLRIKLPPGVRLRGTVDVIGGKKSEVVNDGLVEVGRLAPGERRWVRFRLTSFAGLGKPIPLDVFDDAQPPTNGFTLLLRRTSFENAARRTLLDFASVLTRLAQVQNSTTAKELANAALGLSKNVSTSAYADHLAARVGAIRQMVAAHLRWAKGGDPFEIDPVATALVRESVLKNVERAARAQTALAERLDAHLTMLLRARGSVDDILHNVRWQKALFTRLANVSSATEIVQHSARFLDKSGGASDFPKFIDASVLAMDRAATSLGAKGSNARNAAAALRMRTDRGDAPDTLQKLHRDFLLEVQKLADEQ